MKTLRPAALGLLAIALSLVGGVTALAQDSSPAASPGATPGGPSEGYPVAIHEGTCDAPTTEVAWDLGNAIGAGVDQAEGGDASSLGTVQGAPVLAAMSTIDVKLDDLGNEPHIVAVHASSQDDTIVACGSIGGLKADGKIVSSLVSTNGSTVVGVAILEENGDQTNTTVYVFDQAATPGGTPAA